MSLIIVSRTEDTDPAERDVLWFATAGQSGIAKLENGDYAFVCGRHRILRTVSGDPADLAAFRCDECEAHVANAPFRRRFMQWVVSGTFGLWLCLVAAPALAEEGYLLPHNPVAAVSHSRCEARYVRAHWWSERYAVRMSCGLPEDAPSATPVRGVPSGPTRWVFWSALAAQSATCATQEFAFAKFDIYGKAVGTRVRSCALNLAPVIAVGALGRWMKRADADVSIAPSIGWGVWGTAQNVRDIRKIDALLKGAK